MSDAPSLAQEHSAHGGCCPLCGSDQDGGPIPENIREHYSPPYRWSRTIGISDGDSVFAYECPDCAGQWLRAGRGYRRRAAACGWTPKASRKDGSSQQKATQ